MPIPLPDGATIQSPRRSPTHCCRRPRAFRSTKSRILFDRAPGVGYDHIRSVAVGIRLADRRDPRRLARRPALVQGLRYDEGNRLFVGINRAFGELVARPYEKPRAQLVHYIQPATDLPASQGSQFETEKLHTDTADWDPSGEVDLDGVRPGRSRRRRAIAGPGHRNPQGRGAPRLGGRMLEFLALQPVPWLRRAVSGRRSELARRCLRGQHVLATVHDRDGRGLAGDRVSPTMMAALDSLEEIVNGHARNARLPDARERIVIRGQPQDAARADALVPIR